MLRRVCVLASVAVSQVVVALVVCGLFFDAPAKALPGCPVDPGLPLTACIGDANGDGAFDVSDPVHMLGYLFASGPPPAANALDGFCPACDLTQDDVDDLAALVQQLPLEDSFVSEGEIASVTSGMIVDGAIQEQDLAFDPVTQAELEAALVGSDIVEVYTGISFNSPSPPGNPPVPHELSEIPPSVVRNFDFVVVSVTGQFLNEQGGIVSLGVESRPVGGSYADSLPLTTVFDTGTGGHAYVHSTFSWVHTLTPAEKTNGVQLRISSQAGGNPGASFTNLQTVLELAN